jgi:hypothetical protein
MTAPLWAAHEFVICHVVLLLAYPSTTKPTPAGCAALERNEPLWEMETPFLGRMDPGLRARMSTVNRLESRVSSERRGGAGVRPLPAGRR